MNTRHHVFRFQVPLWLLLAAALTPSVCAQVSVEWVPADWTPTEWLPLPIGSASASASLSEQYAPARIHDGNRRTKWVCPNRPAPGAPAWIAVHLAGGPAEVNAVAVFGERIGNDGLLDADVQAWVDGSFQTLGSVRNATAPSWVVKFAPVRTSQVRLLVLRSSGPTDHTDVWEMVVCGRALSEAELARVFAERLEALERHTGLAADTLRGLASAPTNLPSVLRAALRTAQSDSVELRRAGERWNELNQAKRSEALRRAEAAAALASRLSARSRHATEATNLRRARFDPTRQELQSLSVAASGWAETNRESAVMAGGGVAVRMELKQGRWSAVWTGGLEVGIAGAGFSAMVNGQDLTLSRPKITARKTRVSSGEELELACLWEAGGVRVERELRLDPRGGVLKLGGRIVNQTDREVRLGATKLLDTSQEGGWWAGGPWTAPAALYLQGHSLLRARPFDASPSLDSPETRAYRSSGVLALVGREPSAGLLVGYLRAETAAPEVAADFCLDEGGVKLSAESRFHDRVLGVRETLELNTVCLMADANPLRLLETYGDALARSSTPPPRTGATSLWCSWYAHRMAMTEEKVLANAEVAARHFQPLGLTFIQLDHGWQRGDITGDWAPNERFPHGLKWLADQLRERHGLKLGVWIAPTDVAETSELYRQHPDWMLRGTDGAPRVNWRWYWAPNPNCYELDATHPGAFSYIVDTFRRLSAEGVSYYKIDFIAAAGGEHFLPRDPKATRGWSNLRLAMQAIRAGAGTEAWIRYCQTPPILSAGLANSAYGGDDTLDAGVPGRFDVLRDNAHALAAGYWLNDRPYHREVCDMSVRMQAGLEEARVRAAIMTLANCSISWSDELCYLPPSRVRLMQQCMPPGNPPMRPLDLFERDVPSVWHLRVTNQVDSWDVVGVFNFGAQPETRRVSFKPLGLDPAGDYAVFEFWEERFLGKCRGEVELTLPPETSRILSIRRVTGHPQLIGTDMHLLQGFHELTQLAWEAGQSRLSVHYRRAPGLRGKAFFLVPEGYSPKFDFPLSPASARLTHLEGPLWMEEIEFTTSDHASVIPFTAPKPSEPKEPAGT